MKKRLPRTINDKKRGSDLHHYGTFRLQYTVAVKNHSREKYWMIIKNKQKNSLFAKFFFLTQWQNTPSITVYKIIIQEEGFLLVEEEQGRAVSTHGGSDINSLPQKGKALQLKGPWSQPWGCAQEPDGCCWEIFQWDSPSCSPVFPKWPSMGRCWERLLKTLSISPIHVGRNNLSDESYNLSFKIVPQLILTL